MNINYNHNQNVHTQEGPRIALSRIFPEGIPKSILDVGCGTGTWLKAALDLGAKDIYGIDGVEIPKNSLLIPEEEFHLYDLKTPFDLKKSFNLVLCLEVAEHLEEKYAMVLIQSLTRHSNTILFSAACPGQIGQHHLNCQWPDYWQSIFNKQGYVCEDSARWKIWREQKVEPWYQQNIFFAKKNPEIAGSEMRIPAVYHPTIVQLFLKNTDSSVQESLKSYLHQIEKGCMGLFWYLSIPGKAILEKASRGLKAFMKIK